MHNNAVLSWEKEEDDVNPWDDNVHVKTCKIVIFIPSRSSMVFSSLATVLSANSARVSAWQNTLQLLRDFQNAELELWDCLKHCHATLQLTSSNCQKRSKLFHFRYSTEAGEQEAFSCIASDPAHLLEFVSQNFDLFLVLVLFFWVLWRETNRISKRSSNWWINERQSLSALD